MYQTYTTYTVVTERLHEQRRESALLTSCGIFRARRVRRVQVDTSGRPVTS